MGYKGTHNYYAEYPFVGKLILSEVCGTISTSPVDRAIRVLNDIQNCTTSTWRIFMTAVRSPAGGLAIPGCRCVVTEGLYVVDSPIHPIELVRLPSVTY